MSCQRTSQPPKQQTTYTHGVASRLQMTERRYFVTYDQTKHMVLTRAAANNRAAATDTAPVTTAKPKAAAQAAKKANDTERTRMEAIKKACVAAQRKRDEAAASAYIGTMKYLGKMYSAH